MHVRLQYPLFRLAIAALGLIPALLHAQDTTGPRRAAGRDSVAADSIARLNVVTIAATPAERAQPVSAVHVTGLTLRLTPAATPYELLRQTAGLEVHQQGQGPGFASDASLRGFSSDHSTDIALWVDGVPINEPVNGHAEGYNDWSVLFPGGIQDIDVLHGPTSALFGNFALAGVANVRTLERMRGSEITASGGSFGRAEVMGLTGFDHGRDGGVLGFRFAREHGFRPNADNDVVQGHARLVHDLAQGVTMDGGAELYGSNWNSPGFLSGDEFAAHQYDIVSNPTDGGYKRRAQERLSLRKLTSTGIWRTTVYATEGRWQLFLTIPPEGGRFEGSGSQSEEEDSRAGAGATSAFTWSFSKGEMTVGGETRWDRSHYENYFTTARHRDSVETVVTGKQVSGAPFAQSTINVNDRLRLDLGARYDVLSTRSAPDGESSISALHSVFSPKLGSVVRVGAGMSIYGNVSRGFRSSDGVIDDPTLAPITEWAYEGGVKFDRGGASASATLFRMNVSNEQTFNPITLESSNGGASRRQGLELEWRAPIVPRYATFSGDWTFNDARYRSLTSMSEDDGTVEVLNGLRVFNTSKYVGSAAIQFARPREPWRLRIAGNWIGPYSPFDEPGEVIAGYGLAHVSGSWSFGAVDAELGVRNIFDRAYPEVVAGGVVSPGQPRTVFVSLRVRP